MLISVEHYIDVKYSQPSQFIQEMLGVNCAFTISNYAHLVCWDLSIDSSELDRILTKYGY